MYLVSNVYNGFPEVPEGDGNNSNTFTLQEYVLMKQRHVLTGMFVIVLSLVLAGCSKDNVTGPGPQVQTDAQAMQYMIENVDSVAAFSTSEEFSVDDAGMQESEFDILAKIGITHEVFRSLVADSSHPLRWGRHIFWDQIVRDYHVVPNGDTLALVTVTKTIPGEFWIGWGMRNADTVILDTIIKKPFTEQVKRNILFKRIAHSENHLRNWVPVAITMVEGKSEGTNNFSIASLEISESIGHHDTTVTDPLNTWFRLGLFHGSIPVIPVRDSVTMRVTITSSDDSAEIVYIRHGVGMGGHERRRGALELVSTTGGPGNYTRVYQRTFVTGLPPLVLAERFNAVVDVFSRGTIFDKSAPFSNEFWGIPYIVARY